ncbi:MAG: hypothetical protein V3S64_13405 [bacterium]
MKPAVGYGAWALLGLIGLSVLLGCSPARAADNPSPRPWTVVGPIPASLRACLPQRLHPVSRRILEAWLAGKIETHIFRRFFHLPDSDYLPVGACLVRARAALAGQTPATPHPGSFPHRPARPA